MSEKRHRKDRKDAYYIPETDPMHAIMPYILPNRTDNEAVMNETIKIEKLNEYLAGLNEGNPKFKYTLFHVICAAIAKVVALRPKMNYFFAGHRMYERKELSLTFVVKKKIADDAEEVLAVVKIDRNSDVPPIKQVHDQVEKIVYSVRETDEVDDTTSKMNILLKLPRPILRIVMNTLGRMEYRGKYPKDLMDADPYYSSVFLSNLGSIKMDASYHHLANWGTNSFFVIVGEKHKAPFYDDEGNVTMHEVVNLGLTIDERIADGVYFAKSIKILRKLIENPELLEKPVMEEVEL